MSAPLSVAQAEARVLEAAREYHNAIGVYRLAKGVYIEMRTDQQHRQYLLARDQKDATHGDLMAALDALAAADAAAADAADAAEPDYADWYAEYETDILARALGDAGDAPDSAGVSTSFGLARLPGQEANS